MKIKEYKLISKEENGTFPQLECIMEYDYLLNDEFLYFNHNNYEFEYLFFGEIIKLQYDFTESCYILSYDGDNNPIGIFKVSSGGKNENMIYIDNIFTYLLLSGSKSFITIHNHPNNNSNKSIEDCSIDNSIETISNILNINYKDGLIITKNKIKDLYQKISDFEEKFYNNYEITKFNE